MVGTTIASFSSTDAIRKEELRLKGYRRETMVTCDFPVLDEGRTASPPYFFVRGAFSPRGGIPLDGIILRFCLR